MSAKRMVIIGGGVAGLSTGIYAKQNGFEPLVLEQHTVPGGVCTAWKRKGYTIDGCIHWLMGTSPGSEMRQLYEEVGVLQGDPLFPITEYARFFEEGSGLAVHFSRDMGRMEEEMLAISPTDKPVIRGFVEAIRKVSGMPMPVLKPSDMRSLGEKVKLWAGMAPYLPLVMRSMKRMDAFGAEFKSSTLRKFLPHLFVPEMPLLFGLVLLAQLEKGELSGYRGGSLQFALRMAERYRGLGGELRLGTKVTRILVKGERAVGVELADGSVEKADVVVSAADGHETLWELLGGSFLDDRLRMIYSRWPRFEPLSLVTFGVNHGLGEGTPGTALFLSKPVVSSGRATPMIHYRTFHHDPGLAPAGRNVVQVMVESEWDYWNNLAKDRPAYEAAKQRLADEMLERLTPYLPGLAGNVEMVDVATPYTTWRYTSNEHGYYEGFIATPEAVRNPPPKTLPGLGGLHMVGQWVEPGGGLPPCIYGPRHLVMRLCRESGKKFEAMC